MKKHKFNIFPEIIKNSEDYVRLKNDLDKNGFDSKQPIYLYEEEILDGWNRQQICHELNITPIYKEFIGDDTDAINFVMRTNKRRNLTSSQWATIAIESEDLIDLIKIDSINRMMSGKKEDNFWNEENDPGQLIVQGKTSEKIADIFNTNRQYINDANKLKKENPEVFDQVKSGEKTITQAKREVKRKEIIKNNEEIIKQEVIKPTGKYDVIVIDPAWDMKKIERDVTPEQVELDYPTMTNEEILNIEIPASDNCHIFLWTTQKYLPFAFECLKHWNINYILTFVWHKNGGFQPFGLPQYNCEFCLYGRIGTPEFIDFKTFNTCFSADRTKHSEKPQFFYDLLNRVTGGRKLDMFNRRKINGFTGYGNESK
jgi:N6-adenosine-specific RNA methylase IME4